MKMQALYRIAAVSLILLVGALSGRAQTRTGELTVNIPFDFNVGEKTLPAGDYVISRNFETPNRLTIRSADRSVAVTVYASQLNIAQQQIETRLTFNEYRGQRFLARVQSQSGRFSHELTRAQGERKLIRTVETQSQ